MYRSFLFLVAQPDMHMPQQKPEVSQRKPQSTKTPCWLDGCDVHAEAIVCMVQGLQGLLQDVRSSSPYHRIQEGGGMIGCT